MVGRTLIYIHFLIEPAEDMLFLKMSEPYSLILYLYIILL